MTWNFRIMRRKDANPTYFWYEIVEVYYGEDGIPMMWSDAAGPLVSDLDIEFENNENTDLETFVKDRLLDEYTQMMRDIDSRGPILDERDFEGNGVYANHPEKAEMEKTIKEITEGRKGEEDAI